MVRSALPACWVAVGAGVCRRVEQLEHISVCPLQSGAGALLALDLRKCVRQLGARVSTGARAPPLQWSSVLPGDC